MANEESALGAAMREYLAGYKEDDQLHQQAKDISRRRKELDDRMLTLRGVLRKSVQPVCGSATKPHIRTYTDGTYTTLTVHWDGSLQDGRISVTENEPGT